MKRRIIRFVFALIVGTLLIASVPEAHAQQGTEEQLAFQYYQKAEYDKALVLFEKLFDARFGNFYEQYFQCLLSLQKYEDAEKLTRKMIRKTDGNPVFMVDLGYLLSLQGKKDKAKSEYNRAIKQLSGEANQALALSQAFNKREELDFAIEACQRGKKTAPDPYTFNFELANLYAQKGDVASMIDQYLELVQFNQAYLQTVQNLIQQNLATDEDNRKKDLIRGLLLKKIQQFPEVQAYSELLIWLFIQERDFDSAFIQAKALDKRYGEMGSRIFGLAGICLNNKAWDAAAKCFEYVVGLGKANMNYFEARSGLLQTRQEKLNANPDTPKEEFVKLETEYKTAITELGKDVQTTPLLRGLAHLYAFYLNKSEEAIDLLLETIELSSVRPVFQAECKLELGDIYLLGGEIWETTLLYSQVEKAFKTDALGEDAKLRNARLAYYHGDFSWSQAQLDILKAATSRMISNDAIALSLLIQDNIDEDSLMLPLELYAHADLLFFQHHFEEAIAKLDTIRNMYPSHPVKDDALFRLAHIRFRQAKYPEAIQLFDEVARMDAEGILADDAVYTMAEIYEEKLKDTAKAMELYQQLLNDFPGSLYVVEARKRYRSLRGDKLN